MISCAGCTLLIDMELGAAFRLLKNEKEFSLTLIIIQLFQSIIYTRIIFFLVAVLLNASEFHTIDLNVGHVKIIFSEPNFSEL